MCSDHRSDSRGFTLIELCIALLVFLIGVLGLLQLMVSSVNINQRSLDTTIVTSLAQGKADELLSQSFGSLSSGGVVPTDPYQDPLPSPPGYASPAPTTCYIDYFDHDGNPLTPSASCATSAAPSDNYFVRRWQVADLAGTTNLKKVTITVTSRNTYFYKCPAAILVVYKSKVG